MDQEDPLVTARLKPQTPENVVGHALLVLRGFPQDGIEKARVDAVLIVGALRTCGMLTDDRTALARAEDKAARWRAAYEALRAGTSKEHPADHRELPG